MSLSGSQAVVLKTFVISVAGNLGQTLKSFGKTYLENIVFFVYCISFIVYWMNITRDTNSKNLERYILTRVSLLAAHSRDLGVGAVSDTV